MATTPQAATNPPPGFQPTFKRVPQSTDFDCAFACIAMIVNKPLAEIREVAVDKFKLPAHGPFWVTEELVSQLFAHFGWVSTVYKEVSASTELPDLAVLMVDYDAETEIGRHVLFHRQRGAVGKPNVEYVIDPGYWVEPVQQIRTDVKDIALSWYVGVHQMKPTGK
jgi:hypothetical protein